MDAPNAGDPPPSITDHSVTDVAPEFAVRAQCQVRKLSQVAGRGVTTATRFRDRVAARNTRNKIERANHG
jgi:CHAD domain-containing protein